MITVCGAEEAEKRSVPAHSHPTSPLAASASRATTHRGLPVVRGGLLEGLVELELDLGGFEGALGLHGDGALVLDAHHEVGFGAVSHLPSCKSYTCAGTKGGEKEKKKLTVTNDKKNLKKIEKKNYKNVFLVKLALKKNPLSFIY